MLKEEKQCQKGQEGDSDKIQAMSVDHVIDHDVTVQHGLFTVHCHCLLWYCRLWYHVLMRSKCSVQQVLTNPSHVSENIYALFLFTVIIWGFSESKFLCNIPETKRSWKASCHFSNEKVVKDLNNLPKCAMSKVHTSGWNSMFLTIW